MFKNNRDYCLDLLHQGDNFDTAYSIYLPSLAYYYHPPCAKDLKGISSKV
jgi:hypothetical protein